MSRCLTQTEIASLAGESPGNGATGELWRHLDDCKSCRDALVVYRSSGRASTAADQTLEIGPSRPIGNPEQTIDLNSRPSGRVDQTQSLSPESSRGAVDTERARRHFPTIDGYNIVGVLGQGGMGIVYRAVQAKLNRTVALKVLPAVVGSINPSAVDRFRREAIAAGRLHHTNIIPIYDFGECGDSSYYAMEVIEGEPLNVLIRRFAAQYEDADGVPMPAGGGPGQDASMVAREAGEGLRPYFKQVTRWMTDAADALHYAHGQGIIHRDIKPGNLILSHDGRIMIADFGLAKSAEDESVTMDGALVGTMRYMSPEAATAQTVDHRTDIYALGATFYELLCFQPAVPGTDEKQILSAIRTREPVRPRKLFGQVPPELELICLKALEKSPAARYASAREFADDLRRYSSDLPIAARKPTLTRRLVKFVRRHRAAVVAASVGALLITSLLALIYNEQRRQQEVERREVAEVEARHESGMYYASNGQWEEAEREFGVALAKDPRHVKTLLGLIWMRINQFQKVRSLGTAENWQKVNQICERVLHIEPDEFMGLNYHSIVLKNLKRYDEAIKAAQRVLELNPEYPAAWMNLGAYWALLGDLAQAEECMKKGTGLVAADTSGRSSDYAMIFRNLAALELHLGRPGGEEHLKQAIDLKVGDVISWIMRARQALATDGDMETALDDAKHADRLANGTQPLVKRYLALAWLMNQRPEHAAAAAEAALKLNDAPAPNHLILAAAHARLGQLDSARTQLELAEAQWPAALRSERFEASYDQGVLWLESAVEFERLREAAREALKAAAASPARH